MESSIVLAEQSRNTSGQKIGLRDFELDQLFQQTLVKENYFDLNELSGSYNEYPEFKRLMGHLKRWNAATSKGQKTNSKEMDLFNHLYSMLRCIKYEQPAIQHQNLKKLEGWFMTYYRRTKTLQYQIKQQNLDYQEKNKPFRSRQAHEILKHYSKPYQICLKIFQLEKQVKRTIQDRQNQSIQRCINRRAKKENSKLLEQREQQQMSKTIQQFKQSQAKRRMIYDKIKLRYKNSSQKENQKSHEFNPMSFSKYSQSTHVPGQKKGLPNMVDYILKKMNKTSFDKLYIDDNNISNNISTQSVKSQSGGSKPKEKQAGTKLGTFSSHSKRPEVSTAVGYRLMVNPFMQGQFKKKKR